MKALNLLTRFAVIFALVFQAACTVPEINGPDNGGVNNENNNGNGGNNNGGNGNGGNNDNGLGNSDLTPGQHQSKLEDIAIEFVNYFNPEDVTDIYDSMYRFSEVMEYFAEEELPEMGYAAKLVTTFANTAASLSPARLAQLINRVISEDIIIDPNDDELNPFAGNCYTFNYATYEWEASDIDDNSIKLCWDNDSAELTWGNCKKWDWNYVDEGEHYVVYVPKTVNFSLKINGKEHAAISITTNLTDNTTFAPTATMTVNGGYRISATLDANPKGIGMQAAICKNDKTLASGTMAIAINDFTNPDNWIDEWYDEWDDYYYTDIDPSEYFMEHVKTGEAQLHILDLAVLASGDFKDIFTTYDNIEDNYEGEEASKRLCNLLNEKIQIVAIYTDTNEKVADIKFQPYLLDEWYDEWDDEWYKYYSQEPILVFPDDSKFAFEKFFTERAFSSLIDTIDAFVEKIDNIFY